MPRKSLGPRLYLREREGREPVYVIRDDGRFEESTGCGAGERGGAERALAGYLARKHKSAIGTHDPQELPLADVLDFYATVKAAKPGASKSEIEATNTREFLIAPLLLFFGASPTNAIRGAICRDYVRWRTHEGAALPEWPDRRARAVSDQTARRELVVLSAAINLYHKEYGLEVVPVVTMPAIAPSRRIALTHSEAFALFAGALGFYRTESGEVRRRPMSTRSQRKRTARLILIGIYSGTRSGAILAARWIPCVDGPWIDVDRGILYRRGDLEVARTSDGRRPASHRVSWRISAAGAEWTWKATASPVLTSSRAAANRSLESCDVVGREQGRTPGSGST